MRRSSPTSVPHPQTQQDPVASGCSTLAPPPEPAKDLADQVADQLRCHVDAYYTDDDTLRAIANDVIAVVRVHDGEDLAKVVRDEYEEKVAKASALLWAMNASPEVRAVLAALE